MKNIQFKKFIPHITAIILFIGISYIYFPEILQGKVVNQSDVSSWRGAANEILEYNKQTGEQTLWTNSMFGGMPSYMVSTQYKGNLIKYIDHLVQIGKRPASYICLAMLSFYLLMLVFGVNPWLGIIGSIAFAFSSYNFIIIQVGHNAKMLAIAYMPMVLASVVYAFRKNRIAGSIFLGISLALEIIAKHPQITYYLGLVVLVYGIYEFYHAFKNKTLIGYSKTVGLLVVAAGLAVATNADYLLTTSEYAKYTMRGPSELTHDKGNKTSGLDKDYATQWSYGIDETFNLLIPNYKGGASGGALSEKSETYKLISRQDPSYAKKVIKQMPTYWGPQPFTAGPVYIGAIIIFLFALGLCLIKGKTKWWILTATLLSFALAWGRHFMPLTDLFLDYFPLYNKFRTVSMILVIAQLTIPLLAMLALKKIYQSEIKKKDFIKAMKIALGTTAGFCLLVYIIPSIAGSFVSPQDSQMHEMIANTLRLDRIALLKADAIRSMIFILLAAATIWAVYNKKLKAKHSYIILGLLIIADMWTIDKRYLNNDHFVKQRQFTNQFALRPVDKIILQDKDPNYKVLDFSVNTFNDSHISYHHKTIGGYSAGKLRRYQDMIDFHISKEMQQFANGIKTATSMHQIDSIVAGMKIINMLNTKYIITNPGSAPLANRTAMGNAWFVNDYKIVPNADAEIAALYGFNPKEEAIIDKQFENQLNDRAFNPDENASIKLESYAPNKLVYKTNAKTEQLAVFSEIYYPKGWKVSIDGKEAKHFRANYILRAMIVPAGNHTIVFSFNPDSYKTGTNISYASSLILLLLLAGAVFLGIKKELRKE